MTQLYKLTPTSLTYTYQHCKACFRAIVRDGWQPPATILPSAYQAIDRGMRAAYDNTNPALWSDLPTGVLQTKEKQVVSHPFSLPGFESQFYFSGRTDALIYFGDAHGVIDFKTLHCSKKKTLAQFYADTIALYAPQLYAYAWALENPAAGKLHLPNVRYLGILAGTPAEVHPMAGHDLLTLNRHWLPIVRDDTWFTNFLTEVLTVLDGSPINNANDCRQCWDRHNGEMMTYVRQHQLLLKYTETPEYAQEHQPLFTPSPPG